jgi:DNA-binding MurR/RpiR family transcriptional regulator
VYWARTISSSLSAIQKAKASGVHTVGITDTYVSPVARFASECFITPVEGLSFASSYVAPMAFLDVLISAVAYQRRDRTMKLLKQVAQEERYGYRWYRD